MKRVIPTAGCEDAFFIQGPCAADDELRMLVVDVKKSGDGGRAATGIPSEHVMVSTSASGASAAY